MSQFYDQASLVIVPSGYKAGTVYAQKPLTTDGQLAFTRTGDTATRVNSAGIIEKVRTNVVTYSQNFSDASWTKTAITISTSATANPVNGALTAQDAIPTAVSSSHRILKLTGVVSAANTWSIYAKAKGYNFITIAENGNTSASVSFNLSTGAVSTQNSAVGKIESLGNGWYRCSMIHTTSTTPRFDVYVSPTDSLASYTADGTSGVTLFGAQAEASDFGATPYIPTTTAAVSVGPVANVPRLDYLNSSCPRLLLEPQRTNFATYNEAFSNWGPSAGTITSNATTSPDGYVNADLFTEDTTTGYHRFANSCTGATGTTKTYSIYAKWAGGTGRKWLTIDNGPISYFDLENGVLGNVGANCTNSITAVGNGWYRCVMTHTASGVGTMYVGTSNTNGGSGNHLGNGQPAFYVWGAQCEANASYPTSVIPTLAASATRGADSSSSANISSLFGATEGSFYVQLTHDGRNTNNAIPVFLRSSINGNFNRATYLQFGATNLTLNVYDAGTLQAAISGGTYTNGQTLKIAFAYKANDFVLYVNGVQIGTDTSGAISSSLSFIDFGSYMLAQSTFQYDGKVSQALLFKTRLTNAQLAELTAL